MSEVKQQDLFENKDREKDIASIVFFKTLSDIARVKILR